MNCTKFLLVGAWLLLLPFFRTILATAADRAVPDEDVAPIEPKQHRIIDENVIHEIFRRTGVEAEESRMRRRLNVLLEQIKLECNLSCEQIEKLRLGERIQTVQLQMMVNNFIQEYAYSDKARLASAPAKVLRNRLGTAFTPFDNNSLMHKVAISSLSETQRVAYEKLMQQRQRNCQIDLQTTLLRSFPLELDDKQRQSLIVILDKLPLPDGGWDYEGAVVWKYAAQVPDETYLEILTLKQWEFLHPHIRSHRP